VTKEPRTDGDGEMVTVRFEVKDNGIGISPEAQLKLFRPFMQADDTIIQRFGGTGLGLAISQKVAELMGSRIELSSCPGVGSTFSLQLTLPSCPPEAAVADSIDPASPGRSLHLLVVDDNPINVKVLKRMLETFSHRVTTAGDGAVALEILRHSEDVDMVFMDGSWRHMSRSVSAQCICREWTGWRRHGCSERNPLRGCGTFRSSRSLPASLRSQRLRPRMLE